MRNRILELENENREIKLLLEEREIAILELANHYEVFIHI